MDAARQKAARDGFKYYLPNGDTKTRVACPNASCKSHFATAPGVKNSATPYYSTRSGQPIKQTVFARCRHRNACGYDVRPERQDIDAHLSGAGVEALPAEWTPPPPQPQRVFGELLPGSIGSTALDNYGMSRFGGRWQRVAFRYGVVSKDGANVFQYTDDAKRVHIAKTVRYRIDDAGRLTKKNRKGAAQVFQPAIDKNKTDWILFGAHLVKPGARLAVAESEDTALMMAAAYPDDARVWCASGGDNLRKFREYLQQLRDVQLELFPDLDRINASTENNWYEQAKYLRSHGVRCAVNEWWTVEGIREHVPKLGDKGDLRDWLHIVTAGETAKT